MTLELHMNMTINTMSSITFRINTTIKVKQPIEKCPKDRTEEKLLMAKCQIERSKILSHCQGKVKQHDNEILFCD